MEIQNCKVSLGDTHLNNIHFSMYCTRVCARALESRSSMLHRAASAAGAGLRRMSSSAAATFPFDSPVVFPNEQEGLEYETNYSVNVDGVVPLGHTYRNARTQILANRLPAGIVKNIAAVQGFEPMGTTGMYV
jgi:hypothetical protein